jgi:hypothetical protein
LELRDGLGDHVLRLQRRRRPDAGRRVEQPHRDQQQRSTNWSVPLGASSRSQPDWKGNWQAAHLAPLRAGPSLDIEAGLRTLRAADARFDYLWRRLSIAVSSTRSLIRLTLIAAAFITAYGFFPNWKYLAAENGSTTVPAGLPALLEVGEWVLARLALGSVWRAGCASWRWCSTGCSSIAVRPGNTSTRPRATRYRGPPLE